MASPCQPFKYFYRRCFYCHLKSFVKTVAALMSIKHGFVKGLFAILFFIGRPLLLCFKLLLIKKRYPKASLIQNIFIVLTFLFLPSYPSDPWHRRSSRPPMAPLPKFLCYHNNTLWSALSFLFLFFYFQPQICNEIIKKFSFLSGKILGLPHPAYRGDIGVP